MWKSVPFSVGKLLKKFLLKDNKMYEDAISLGKHCLRETLVGRVFSCLETSTTSAEFMRIKNCRVLYLIFWTLVL
jgi:hypothetical protein